MWFHAVPRSKVSRATGVVLETPRLVLRPMRDEDQVALQLVFTDPRVMASFGGPIFTGKQMQAWLRRNLEHQAKYGYGLFSVVWKESGELIGDCGLEKMELDHVQDAELGYDIRSHYWNRGSVTEAAVAVRDFAFYVLNMPRLISLIRVGTWPLSELSRR